MPTGNNLVTDELTSHWLRDAIAVAVTTIAIAGIAILVDANEVLFRASRRFENLQLDEIPVALFVLAMSLMWFAWRRHRETQVELARRDVAERQLEEQLRENRRLSEQHVSAQEAERKRLARELHDEAGQYLNAIKTYAVTVQSNGGPSHRDASLIIEHTDRAYEAVRNIIRQLRPVGLDELGLKAALEHLVDQVHARVPRIAVHARIEGDVDALSETMSLTLYRLAQEGFTNVAKHAQARQIDLQVLRSEEGAVEFRMRDDGRGCDLGAQSPGVGLLGMRERVAMSGGEWSVTSTPATGFEIVARFRT
jgi:signal transduction histidine kinase